MAPAPTTTTTITPPRSSHGISDSWGYSASQQQDSFDLDFMSNHSHINGNSHQSSNELASRKMSSNDNLNGKNDQGSEKPSMDDPWTYNPRENAHKRTSVAVSEHDGMETSKWIHRDKLARIENEELQAAGIYIPRARAQSKQRRERSRSTMRRGTDASEHSHRSRKDSMLESRPENIVNSWDIRTPEEIAEEEANAHLAKPSSKASSRIPVPKISPAPVTSDPFDRTSRKTTDSPEDNEPLTNTKTRSRSASMKGTDPTSMGNLAAAKRSVTDISPKKAAARKTSGPKSGTTARPKTRSGSTKESNGSISTRPSTRSGELTKAPEGDPPWMINSYKPDPRLPPDQQLLPTVARRLQQEKWEKEGKFGDVYDKEFRPLNDHVYHPPEDKPRHEDDNHENHPEDEWPLKLEPSKSRGCLIMLLKFWTRLADDMQDIVSSSGSTEPIKFNPEDLSKCLKVLTKLVMEERVTAYEGWVTVIDYLNHGLNGSSSLEVFIFCRAMVFAACGFGAIAELFSEALLLDPTSLTFGANNGGYPHSVLHLSSFYVKILDSVLLDLAGESSGHQKLQHLLSSLSKLEDNREDLKEVRSAVWERLIIFSDNMQLQREVRVYVLELMQFISGRNFGGVSAKFPSNVRPWEGWVELQCTTSNEITDHGGSNRTDTSSRFTSTLIALKSTQLAAAISPNVEVTPDDLLTIDSAVSCFLNLCRVAITKSNINALVSILGEWEGLFTSVRDEDDAVETYDTGNNWSSDEWDAGWESFQEEPVEKEKKGKNFHVDPLHKCWIEILKKFMVISQLTDVFKLIDQSLTKSNGILLDEDGAQILARLVLELDCFAALKIVLLLPYQEVQLECLDAVEAKLKREGVTDIMSGDHELFTLILSSGVLSTIMKTPSYRTTFLYLCYLVGHFSHLWQEALLSWHRHKRGGSVCDKNDVLVVFSRILFPYFVSELINSGQQILAGFLVTKFMRTHASLSLINVAEASLRRYLEGQVRILQTSEPAQEEMDLCMTLRNTISVLKGKLESRIQSALLSLSTTVK